MTILYNLLCAVNFMHSANVMHRDIKPSNILIDEKCNIKICDFGISRTIPEERIGKGSGNSYRFRNSLIKMKEIEEEEDPEKLRKIIVK